MIYMPTVTMSMEEYLALVQGVEMIQQTPTTDLDRDHDSSQKKSRSRSSKYARTYKREFRKIASRFKTKSGKWKKDGFKTAVRSAHRATRRILG